MKILWYSFLLFNIVVAQDVLAQENETSKRLELAYEFLNDSCYRYGFGFIDYQHREKDWFPDSVLMPSVDENNTLSIRTKKWGRSRRSDWGKNYIYQSIGDSLAKEFLAYQITAQLYDTAIEDTSNHIVDYLPRDTSISEFGVQLLYSHNQQRYWRCGPLFSKNTDMMLVELGDWCGSNCGVGYALLFEYKEGRWVEKLVIRYWKS